MSDDLLPQFLFEGRELVQQAGDALLQLEREAGPGTGRPDRGLLDRAFRAVHTLKGSTGLFDLRPMGTLLHAVEDVLDRLRSAPDPSAPVPFDALLRCLGACELWLDAIERHGALPANAAEDALRLQHLLPEQDVPGAIEPSAPPPLPGSVPDDSSAPGTPPDWAASLLDRFAPATAQARRSGRALVALRYRPAADCFFLGDDPTALLAAVPELVALHLDPVSPPLSDPFTCVLVATLLSTATADALRAAFRTVPDQVEIVVVAAAALARPETEAPDTRLLRVDAGRIDTVVDLAGEMLVARNALGAILQALGEQASGAGPVWQNRLALAYAEIDRLARALRVQTTALRLSPLEHLFRRLPRLVREIASADGKDVELVVSGGAVELDRTIADRLFEPLLHVLRNAVGHGLEPPPLRRSVGKPERGRIRVRAEADGAQVTVIVDDDGRGIDPERVRTVARARRLMDDARLDALDAAGCLELLFLPGFSTATEITALSGRGVGMDAVRAAVSVLGGRVGLQSRPGHGTEVRIALPRDVSISTVLLVRVGGESVAVPIASIREIVRLLPERVSSVGVGEAFTLRERVLPLLCLARLLDLPSPPDTGGPAMVLVAQVGGHRAGFTVDAVTGRLELMVRRLDGFLRGTRGVAGTALGPDGRVLMVLDLAALLDADAAPERGA